MDDEPWASDLLTSYIQKVDYLQLLLASDNPVQALNYITVHKPDLVFLDIRMPEMTGLQVMEMIGTSAKIIVTSAYSEYALHAFEHNIVDYLMKPIEFSRFFKSAERAKDAIVKAPQKLGIEPLTRKYLFIKTDGKLVKVNFNEILYIEGLKDYIAIHTLQGKLISLDSLLNMEGLLPAQTFLRVHKSYIVSLEHIETIERNRLFIKEHVIPIGEQHRQNLFKMIGKH